MKKQNAYEMEYPIEVNGDEVVLTVEYVYTPGCPGTYYDPPDEDDLDILSAHDANGKEYELTNNQIDDIFQLAAEIYGDN